MNGRPGGQEEGARGGAPGLRIAAVAAALIAGAGWRLGPVGGAFLFGDEFHSLRDLAGGYGFVFTHFSDTGSGMALPILVRALGDLFGYGHWTIRAPAYVGGLATLACCYPVARRWTGAAGAAVATFLVATSPLLIFYSHFGRSYMLVTWLCLLLWKVLQDVVDGAPAGPGRCAACAGLTALLPYVQPVSLGFALPATAGACIALGWDRRRRGALALAASAFAGGVATLAMHAPARASILAYLRFQGASEYHAGFAAVDVAALLVGSRTAALAALVAVPAALGAALARRGASALPLVLGSLGPAAAVAIARPFGGPYAYARYLLPAIPFVCVLLGDAVAALARRGVAAERPREVAVLAAGALLAAALFAVGPYGPRRTPDGPYANTYITMFPLPAFDVPWPGWPAFYEQLASEPDDVRIVEAPALVTRTRHLYRNYYLRHRKQTSLGFAFGWELASGPVPDGPYVSFDDPSWRERCDADYLILHTAIGHELRRYWDFVYGEQRRLAGEPSVAAYMARQQRYGGYQGALAEVPSRLRSRLRAELGEPVFRDAEISVWRLRAPAPPAGDRVR